MGRGPGAGRTLFGCARGRRRPRELSDRVETPPPSRAAGGCRRFRCRIKRRSPTAPATTPCTAAGKHPQDEEQHDGTEGGVDDERDQPNTKMDVQPRQQPIADERPDDADDQISYEAEPAAIDDFSR